ncbi:hypothetical protein N7G274_008054 [Stereocaulon virgatum]|uniref:Uncharacterized protein n=1 Tax=Stereocaulon virgatum TaxID=373712 RepID=A0ABR4A273_9LECA
MDILTARNKTSNAVPPACAVQPPKDNNTTLKCNVTLVSAFPAHVFNPDTYTQFCEAVEKDPKIKLSWIVDNMGYRIPTRKENSKSGGTASEQNIMACSAASDSNCGADTFGYSIDPSPSSKASCKPPPKIPGVPQPDSRVCMP